MNLSQPFPVLHQ